jgi:hypothetical protein
VTTGSAEWFTPYWVTAKLGGFGLDPCATTDPDAPVHAYHRIMPPADGLAADWTGNRIWLNSPYGRETGAWLKKLALHGDGIALMFARTDTQAFFDHVWGKASGIFFFRGRIKFLHRKAGKLVEGDHAGAPSVLVSYDRGDSWRNAEALKESGLPGYFVDLTPSEIVWSGWKWVLRTILNFGPLTLAEVYYWVEKCVHRPENSHVKEKVRQTLNRYTDLFVKTGDTWGLVEY